MSNKMSENSCNSSYITNKDSSVISQEKAACTIRENATIRMAQPDIYIQRGIKQPIFQSYQAQMMYLQGQCHR